MLSLVNKRKVSFREGYPYKPIQAGVSSFVFNAFQSGANPVSQSTPVYDTDGRKFIGVTSAISYISGAGWASVNLIDLGGSWLVSISCVTGTLTPGTYEATVTINAGNASAVKVLDIDFIVAANPSSTIMSLSTVSPSFNFVEGSTVSASQPITVGTEGGPSLVNLATGTFSQAWCTGPLTGNSINCTVDPTGKLVGLYQATFLVTADNASNSPRTVTVSMRIATAAPIIELVPSTKVFSATQGGANPASQTIQINNSGTGSLTGLGTAINYLSGAGWLGVSLNTTTAPAVLTISPVTGALTAGTYVAEVTVSGTGAVSVVATITFIISSGPPPVLYQTPDFALPTFVTFSQVTGLYTTVDPFTRPLRSYFTGTVHVVNSFADWQAKIAIAADRDIIRLSSDFTMSGGNQLSLGSQPGPTGWILVESASQASLPSTRAVVPFDFTNISAKKITSTVASYPIRFEVASRGWWLDGIWLDNQATTHPTALCQIGDTASYVTSADWPVDIVITRCFLNGNGGDPATLVGVRHGIMSQGYNSIIERNCVMGIHSSGNQCFAINGHTGGGRYKIFENVLEASGAAMIFGGSAFQCGDAAYCVDISYQRNFFFRRLAWMSYASTQNVGVNFWEVKIGLRVLAAGNVFKNYWSSQGQTHMVNIKSIAINAADQPRAQTWDVTFTCNDLSGGGFNNYGHVKVVYPGSTGSGFKGWRIGNIEVSNNRSTGCTGVASTSALILVGTGVQSPLGQIIPNVHIKRNNLDGNNPYFLVLDANGTGSTKSLNAANSLPGLVITDILHTGSQINATHVLGSGTIPDGVAGLDHCAGTGLWTVLKCLTYDVTTPSAWNGSLNTDNKNLEAVLTYDANGILTGPTSGAVTGGGTVNVTTSSTTSGIAGCDIELLRRAIAGVEPTGTTGLPAY